MGRGGVGLGGESHREIACVASRAEQVGAMLAVTQVGDMEEITGDGIRDGLGPEMKVPLLSCHL